MIFITVINVIVSVFKFIFNLIKTVITMIVDMVVGVGFMIAGWFSPKSKKDKKGGVNEK